MADVKNLTRDTAREEYFYRLGFQHGYSAFNGEPFNVNTERALTQVAQHAREQVPEPNRSYYDE